MAADFNSNQQSEQNNNIKNEEIKEIKNLEIQPKVDIFEILKIVSPGTALRTSMDDLVKSKRGALIAVFSKDMEEIMEGGVKLNCNFTPQRLFELCKMDGAVILSEDMKKILNANVMLIPDPKIHSDETGTRHKTAERTAKQANTLVIAISEKKGTMTVYYSDMRYVLKNTEEVLRRATETLQILEKQRELYDELMVNLNVLEVTGLVSVSDICNILQRIEMINRISETIKKNLVELGKEGSIVKIRLRELIRGIDKTEQFLLQDYMNKPDRIKQLISEISFDDLIDTEGMSSLLLNKTIDEPIQPKGYRFLKKTRLGEQEILGFIAGFKNLNNILNLDIDSLVKIIKDADYARQFQKEIASLKESIMVGKKI